MTASDVFLCEVWPNATNAELIEQSARAMVARDNGAKVVGCTITGFGGDPRDLWDIPAAVALCRRMLATGHVAALDPFVGGLLPPGTPPAHPLVRGVMGSFDVWAIAKGHVRGGRVALTWGLIEKFKADLAYLNTVQADHLSGEEWA